MIKFIKKLIKKIKSIWQKETQNPVKSVLVKGEKVKRKSVKVQKINKSPNTGGKGKLS
jgi:hypothetical protein